MELSESIQVAVELISHWDSETGRKLILDSGLSGQNRYLEAVDKILHSDQRDELKDAIFMAVARLKLEFQTTLCLHKRFSNLGVLTKKRTESIMGSSAFYESSSSMTETSSYGDNICSGFGQEDDLLVQYIRKIAERISSCGHLAECILIYSQVRKPFLDERIKEFQAVDVKKISAEELKMTTKRWIQAAKVYTKLLFVQEKKMAELVFGGLGISIVDQAFMLTVEDAAVNVFSFVEIVSSSHQSSERLEIILILCDGFLSLVHDMDALFGFQDIKSRLAGILSGFQVKVRRMLSDFQNAVLHEKSMILHDVADVHVMTKYVMGWYISLLLKHQKLLTSLIVSNPSKSIGSLKYPDGELQDPGSLSPLSLHIVSIIAVLLLNLEHKSKKYKKTSFSYMFMVKNIQFILLSIKQSRELETLVGTEYLKKLTHNLERAKDEMKQLMMHCLNEEDVHFSHCFCHGVSTSVSRKKGKSFNSLCENMHVFQSPLQMDNPSLCEELCESTMRKLVRAYKSFLKKFGRHLKSGKDRKQSILCSQEISVNYTEQLESLFLQGDQLCPSPQLRTR